ncbi:hypothetical protein O3P69_009083 [Scylla paramamosain]|uniref:Uncharacterized protein n=1 Tax=Scylla paramamosain TaxID=85552 RepID=A0AAW0TPZ3_SCYPA
MKKANVERHYSSKHAKLSDLGGQMRLDKINALRRCLESQQVSFTRPRCDRDNVIQTSYALSDLIAKKLKPHIEGEFVKECIVKAAELLAPDKLQLFQSVSLSRRTVSDRITDLAQDIHKTLKDSARDFQFFSVACDETTDITNTAQLAIFVRGITAEFDTREELLSLEAMHGTTTEYGDLVYHCEVRWLSRGKMLMRFYELRDEVKQFMEMKGTPVRELSDSKWLCDLAFMVDITKYLSELNVKLQGPPTSFSALCFHTRHALKYASVFGTTYCCEQFFSKLTLAKSRLRSRLTDANLENQLRVASSTVPPNTPRQREAVPAVTLESLWLGTGHPWMAMGWSGLAWCRSAARHRPSLLSRRRLGALGYPVPRPSHIQRK